MAKLNEPHIRVTVETQFIETNSMVELNKYFFSYTVTIKNQGVQTVQLIGRHWIIQNSNKESFEVKGL